MPDNITMEGTFQDNMSSLYSYMNGQADRSSCTFFNSPGSTSLSSGSSPPLLPMGTLPETPNSPSSMISPSLNQNRDTLYQRQSQYLEDLFCAYQPEEKIDDTDPVSDLEFVSELPTLSPSKLPEFPTPQGGFEDSFIEKVLSLDFDFLNSSPNYDTPSHVTPQDPEPVNFMPPRENMEHSEPQTATASASNSPQASMLSFVDEEKSEYAAAGRNSNILHPRRMLDPHTRQKHNSNERERRKELNDHLERLRERNPLMTKCKKASKNAIISISTERCKRYEGSRRFQNRIDSLSKLL